MSVRLETGKTISLADDVPILEGQIWEKPKRLYAAEKHRVVMVHPHGTELFPDCEVAVMRNLKSGKDFEHKVPAMRKHLTPVAGPGIGEG